MFADFSRRRIGQSPTGRDNLSEILCEYHSFPELFRLRVMLFMMWGFISHGALGQAGRRQAFSGKDQ